jgi:hypothetical protein
MLLLSFAFKLMKSECLDGARFKIDRAIDHLKNLDIAIGQLWASESKITSAEAVPPYKTEGEDLIVFRPHSAPVNPSFSLIVGDFVHNVRSSLDHLVYQLAILNKASSEGASKTSFPVCLTHGEFTNATRKKVAPFIGPRALTELEKLQPYSTGNGKRDILWILSQLDIIDKHRLLIVTKSKVRPINFTVTTRDGNDAFCELPVGEWKSSEAGTELLRFQLSAVSLPPGEVKVKIGTAMTVQIEQSGLSCDGTIIQLVLENCISYTANIIDQFGRMFFSE